MVDPVRQAVRWPGRWWGSVSLRARLTLLATALAGVAMAAGALLLAAVAGRALLAAADAGALQSAREVAALVDADRLPDPVPVGAGSTAAVQVLDGQDRVRAASAGTDRLVSLLRPDELARARAGQRLELDGSRAGLDAPLRVLAVSAGSAGDPRTVVVGTDLVAVADSIRLIHTALLAGAPLLLVLLAAGVWRVTGSTLRPVEALRRGAEEISGTSRRPGAERLPVPVARDEVYRLATTLNAMLARLGAATERQQAFVADAAHELRSPLASIRTQLEVAARVDAGTPAGELAADVLLDVDRLAGLADDLLLLARLDDRRGGRRARPPERVDVAALAGTVTGRYRGARVPVTVTAPAGPAPVPADPGPALADPDTLTRVLANLLDNAVRHAASRVEVRVAGGEPGRVLLTVSDDGPGIAAADRDRVFDRFTRLDAGRDRDSGGAGLGLPIVRELVRAAGGTVTLADADPGLRVAVTLPAAGGDG